jgi:hypothetical protein
VNVNDVVAARIAAARIRIAASRKRRERQQAARDKGLAARHAAKLRNLAGTGTTPQIGPRAATVRRRDATQEKEHLAELAAAQAFRRSQAAQRGVAAPDAPDDLSATDPTEGDQP